MSSSLNEVSLGEVVKLVIDYRGKTPLKLGGNWSPKGYRAISAKNIESGRLKNIDSIRFVDDDLYRRWMKDEVERNDILITSEAPFGEAILWNSDEKIVLSQRVFGLRLDEKIACPEYVYFYMQSYAYKAELEARATGSTVRGLRQPELLKTKILLPDIAVQKQIAKILGDLDQKIELNRRMNETLEQIGQVLFKKYFVDNPESESWEKKPLDEIADFKNGLACQKYPPSKNEKGLRVIKIREMSSGFTDSSDTVGADFPEDYIIENGDLLFAWSGTLMTKIWTEGKGALNQHIFRVTSEKYPKWFYYHWVDEHLKRFKMIAKSKAVTMGHIKRSHLSEVDVKVPPKEFFDIYDRSLSILLEKRTEVMIENNTLIDLRDSLLPKLISGEITV